MTNSEHRSLEWDAAGDLAPGDEHYRAYVGPPAQYDVMGSTQFALLTSLGLRDTHKVLDFGCGSLRLGRLLIPHLRPGNYFGLDPNRWLMDDAIEHELGSQIIALRRPHFFYDEHFEADACGNDFDFIVAQSIFSHAAPDLTVVGLRGIARALDPQGLALVTFALETPNCVLANECSGWVYPNVVGYTRDHIDALVAEAGLERRALGWQHPRQSWYALAHEQDQLPSTADAARRGTMSGVDGFA